MLDAPIAPGLVTTKEGVVVVTNPDVVVVAKGVVVLIRVLYEVGLKSSKIPLPNL